MSWIDDSVNKGLNYQDEETLNITKYYEFYSPIIIKILTEVGDSLFTKKGIFSLKKYYKIKRYNPDEYSNMLLVFETETPMLSLCERFYITFKLEKHKGELNGHATNLSPQHICYPSEDVENKIKEFIKKAITEYTKKNGKEIFRS